MSPCASIDGNFGALASLLREREVVKDEDDHGGIELLEIT